MTDGRWGLLTLISLPHTPSIPCSFAWSEICRFNQYRVFNSSNWQAGHLWFQQSWCWLCTESDFLITSNWAADRSLCFFCYPPLPAHPSGLRYLQSKEIHECWHLTTDVDRRTGGISRTRSFHLSLSLYLLSLCLSAVLCVLSSLPHLFLTRSLVILTMLCMMWCWHCSFNWTGYLLYMTHVYICCCWTLFSSWLCNSGHFCLRSQREFSFS